MLTLYRRHTRTCDVHGTRLAARAKRSYTECACPIWIYGRTDTEAYPRQSTKLTDWKAAEALRLSLTKKGKDQTVHGPRIADCVARFIESRRHKLGKKTSAHYALLLGRLVTYCATRGAHFMSELNTDLLEDFKVEGLPEISDATKSTAVAKLRCFLREAFRRDWIATHLAEKVTRHEFAYEQKAPYSDAEIDLILAEALKINGSHEGYAEHPQTFRLLLDLMLETGMRVSDAVSFDPSVLQKDEALWVYSYSQVKNKRTKRPEMVEAYISERLKSSIDLSRWFSPSRPFWIRSISDLYGHTKEVWRRMQSIGKRCGVADCRPHRLRDTFAVRALLRGISIGDVSRLLGHHGVKMTEMYYAKWIPARTRRLASVFAQSLVNPNGDTVGNR